MPVGGESGRHFIGGEPICVGEVARQTTVPKSFPMVAVRRSQPILSLACRSVGARGFLGM